MCSLTSVFKYHKCYETTVKKDGWEKKIEKENEIKVPLATHHTKIVS